jgi:uncharacterized protein
LELPELILPGAAGRLEAQYTRGKTPNAPIALILHPHPKTGGHMNNAVTVQLFRVFMKRGFATLRYNSRGVGKSQGEFDSGIGELGDAATALDWLQADNPTASQTWVAGYQYGAYIGMQLLMRRPETDGFISVTPPANVYDFTFLAPCPASGLILHGEADTVAPHADTDRMVAKLRTQKGISIAYDLVPGATHFWQDHLAAVEQKVGHYVDQRMNGLTD